MSSGLFKFSAERTVQWPVTISQPIDGGMTRETKVRATLEIIDTKEQDAIYDAGGRDMGLLKRVVKDWEGMPSGDGQSKVPFSAEALDEAIQIPFVRTAFIEAYLTASVGKAAARKN